MITNNKCDSFLSIDVLYYIDVATVSLKKITLEKICDI